MAHSTHTQHTHVHGKNCGHTTIEHSGHIDYLHEGHLHCEHEGHYDEHVIEVSASNPNTCKPIACGCGHVGCGHETVPHGNHMDYIYEGRLHHRHGDHCDDHGPITVR
jgi:hypothetical protein